jgi:CheY-like chemotaxis protein
MSSTRLGESDVAAGSAARLVVEYDDLAELIADCAQTLARGETVVATSRSFAERATVRLSLTAPGLVVPIGVSGHVRSCDAATGEVTIELGAADGRRLAELVARLRRADPELVGDVMRLLIAEDNPHLAQLICNGLVGSSRRGGGSELGLHFEFQSVVDGLFAINVLQARRFDVAIIDVYLPTVSGAQVIEAARGGIARDLPIIAVSAGGDPARRLAQDAGADVFLAKPFRLRDLYDTIVALVRRRGGSLQPTVA